ncbi:hypothetical protein GE061_012970 [Apolygus lucorum]|uniref:Uncharacterized protein n=1 Tax=Apolygus lucorum TaxID=248454 RepID=A0A8S9XU35_APOLU|nr:hypothetical protein GE061_012970 [Apolygus lucorum]
MGNTLKEVPLPPEPVVTRWGTWLTAVNYYAKNLNGIREVFTLLDSEDAESIARAKEALAAPESETQLHYIDSNFGALPDKIELLQRQNTLLIEAVETVEEFGKDKWAGQMGKKAKDKLEAVLKRNPAWEDIRAIAARLRGGVEATIPICSASKRDLTPAGSYDNRNALSELSFCHQTPLSALCKHSTQGLADCHPFSTVIHLLCSQLPRLCRFYVD